MDSRDSHTAVHSASDVDEGPLSQHHTIGPGAGQAAPGDEYYSRSPAFEYEATHFNYLEIPPSGGALEILSDFATVFEHTAGYKGPTATRNGGLVTVEGLMQNNTLASFDIPQSTSIATIPDASLHPDQNVVTWALLSSNQSRPFRVNILRNGIVQWNGGLVTVGVGGYIALTGACYRARDYDRTLKEGSGV
jgi:hypothetical protein